MRKRKLQMKPDTTRKCEDCKRRLSSVAHSGERGGYRCVRCHCRSTEGLG
jgi:tRNA(Ile2) C34 agmatinyltransferase TiaS